MYNCLLSPNNVHSPPNIGTYVKEVCLIQGESYNWNISYLGLCEICVVMLALNQWSFSRYMLIVHWFPHGYIKLWYGRNVCFYRTTHIKGMILIYSIQMYIHSKHAEILLCYWMENINISTWRFQHSSLVTVFLQNPSAFLSYYIISFMFLLYKWILKIFCINV